MEANNIYNTYSKRKSMIFLEGEKYFLEIFDFSPFEVEIVRNNCFNFSKILKTNFQNDFFRTIKA